MRTFAVVARLLSISRAAEELSVTPSAVSHQIKVLEDYLGTSLFRREKNKLRLTAVGQQYMSDVSEGLMLLTRATRSIKSADQPQTLRVGVPPSFAILWLLPRLHKFTRLHPDVALSITASPDPPPLMPGAFDMAFWYGSGVIPGLVMTPLGPNHSFPICSPRALTGDHALRTPRDLARCTLLDSADEAYYGYREARQPSWFGWLQAAGLNEIAGRRVMSFTPRVLMHYAVAAGIGVGLSRSLLAVDALRARQIAVPFGPTLALPQIYNLVYPSAIARRKDVAAFREWVAAETAASAKQLDRILKRHIK